MNLGSQERVEDIQKTSEVSLASTRESFSSQLRQLEQAKDKLEAKSVRMKEQLNSARSQEAHLRSLVAELGEYVHAYTGSMTLTVMYRVCKLAMYILYGCNCTTAIDTTLFFWTIVNCDKILSCVHMYMRVGFLIYHTYSQ